RTRLRHRWGAPWICVSPGVDADQGAGLGVTEPDRAGADRQPAVVDAVGADRKGVHDLVADRIDALQQPPPANTQTAPSPITKSPGRCWASRRTVATTRRLAGSIRARV